MLPLKGVSHLFPVIIFNFIASASAALLILERNSYHAEVKRATCTPASGGDASIDDVPEIESAISACGAGGSIIIPASYTYTIRSVLDFAGRTSRDFRIEGTLKASDDLDYWEGRTAIIYTPRVKGARIRSVTGTGVINGNGQAAYDKFSSNSSYA
ncbi:glycoside hydrolase family 28 protein [Glonium stellatum]|uniref:Glycoside hydrolase family 28 protein n=1 Tax=Glonium stellatum TaxID=574774 RepID=A0A8E2EST1_9PEZI|nr:glycoside hydrolase family 28 protein [Glonium stellatum]